MRCNPSVFENAARICVNQEGKTQDSEMMPQRKKFVLTVPWMQWACLLCRAMRVSAEAEGGREKWATALTVVSAEKARQGKQI